MSIIYIQIYIYIYIYKYTYTYTYICVNMYIYICIPICRYISLIRIMYTYAVIHEHAMCACVMIRFYMMHMYTCATKHTYIHTYTPTYMVYICIHTYMVFSPIYGVHLHKAYESMCK
jgi:hypothetical protein